jgi:hypothetical protein
MKDGGIMRDIQNLSQTVIVDRRFASTKDRYLSAGRRTSSRLRTASIRADADIQKTGRGKRRTVYDKKE